MCEDIRPKWRNVARRMQAATSGNNGIAVVTISVVVDQDGNPLVWSPPKCVKLEPKSLASDTLQVLIEALTDGA